MKNINTKEEILGDTKDLEETEAQVTVHISFTNYTIENQLLRVWKSTYLFPEESANKSILLHFYNISFYPKFMTVAPGKSITFTLIFSALPKECKRFDLREIIPEPGGFHFKSIKRNATDVYHLTLN